MRKLPRARNRYPGEHESLSTEVKQLQISEPFLRSSSSQAPTNDARTALGEYPSSNFPVDPAPSVAPDSAQSSFTVCRPPNDFLSDESFEVSGEILSTSIFTPS